MTNWIKTTSDKGFTVPNMQLSPKLQEIYDNFQLATEEENKEFFGKVMGSLSNKEKGFRFVGEPKIVSSNHEDFDFHVNQKFQSDLELEFDTEVQLTLQKIQQLLLVKGVEYRRNNDPFHNFKVGSQISGEIPEKVLQGFLLKHLVSYQDMLNDIEQGKLPTIELVEEKFTDIQVYFIIQKILILNRIKKS